MTIRSGGAGGCPDPAGSRLPWPVAKAAANLEGNEPGRHEVQDIRTKSSLGLMTVLSLRGLGPVTALKVARAFDTFGEMLDAAPEAFKGVANEPGRRALTDRQGMVSALDKVRQEIENTHEIGARLVSVFDADYPERLARIPDRPLVLYVSGDLSVLDRSVACVGTREPNEFGATVAERVTGALADDGWTIVSGLARGVDRIVHETAIRHGVPTVAVIGSGIDTFAPQALQLIPIIEESGGAIVSEQPLGTQPDPSTLVRRNRIQTGASVATFVMQCRLESGTMHAVRYALHQGRPLYCPQVPERFATDPDNDGVTTMLRLTGPQLAEALVPAPSKNLREVLETGFGHRPIVKGIAGREAYPEILSELRSFLEPRDVNDVEFTGVGHPNGPA